MGKAMTMNRKQRPGGSRAREAVVGISAVLMALAVGLGLALQAQVSAIVATAVGLGVWCALMLVHMVVRRVSAVAGIDDELAHLRAEVDRLASAPNAPPAPVAPPQRVKMALRTPSNAAPQGNPESATVAGDISEAISQALAHKRASESRTQGPAAGPAAPQAQAPATPPPTPVAPPRAPAPRAAAPVPPMPAPAPKQSAPAMAPAAKPAAPANAGAPRPALGAVRPRRSAAAAVKTEPHIARQATPPPPPPAQQTGEPDLTWREWQEILNRDAAAPAEARPASQAARTQPPPVKAPAPASAASAPAAAPAAATRAAPNPFAFRPAAPPSLKVPAQGGATPPNLDQSVDQIQDLIRRLAIDINGPLAGKPAEGAPAGPPPPPFAAQAEAEAAVTRSAEALDVTAGAMRASLAAKDARAMGLTSQSAQAATSDDASDFGGDPLAASLAEAITAERFDVFIEPIHALPDRKPRHFEVSVRLRTGDGASIEKADVAGVLRRCGLMPGLDAANMLRAAKVAQWLNTRGRDASVLSAVAGQSLDDAAFLDRAAQAVVRGGRTNLVLAFAQSDVRLFAPAHHRALAMLANIGFRFALEEVTDLGMDFSELVTAGFSFVKLDASVFLEGLATADGFVPAADICRYLADHGLTLIVGHIEDERQLAKVLGFGVLFGKGRLFGGPKPVKAEVLGQPGVVAA